MKVKFPFFIGVITLVTLAKVTFFNKHKNLNDNQIIKLAKKKQIQFPRETKETVIIDSINDIITEQISYLDEKIEKLSQVVYDLIETKKPQGGRKRAKANQV